MNGEGSWIEERRPFSFGIISLGSGEAKELPAEHNKQRSVTGQNKSSEMGQEERMTFDKISLFQKSRANFYEWRNKNKAWQIETGLTNWIEIVGAKQKAIAEYAPVFEFEASVMQSSIPLLHWNIRICNTNNSQIVFNSFVKQKSRNSGEWVFLWTSTILSNRLNSGTLVPSEFPEKGREMQI